ncbi:hypothetical protein [Flavobacterium silvaticum]|uniref:Uncharacterized protein n=1 Tax=Flavobacterium silvaticum TaxID=1852020 RepID=A0A972FPR2_9FLAO|nr:hypothetical protein [Flavobacterium silvaticum]NMH27154.1 hypothetical protein [Flavobacterium silvaticum]
MEKRNTLGAEKIYFISQSGNNEELIFPKTENESYFIRLMEYHIQKIGNILHYDLKSNRVRLIIRIKPESEIPEQYRKRIHQPISNLFNAYTKALNKYTGRSGSLFVKNFERRTIWTSEQLEIEVEKIYSAKMSKKKLSRKK